MALTKVTGQVIKSDTNITSHNINSSGIITAVSFSGPLDTTGGNFTGIITATSATFSGNVTIGGTLTYEDVTNIDSLGIVTARNGLRVTAGGINVTAGVSTFSALVDVNNRLDVVGGANIDQVNVTGVSTFTGTIDANGSIDADGGANIVGGATIDQANVTGVSTFTGAIDANGGASIDNIQIGVTGDNEIDTSSGNLTIDSSGGTTNITDILNVTGSHVNLETGSASTQMQLRFGTNAEKSRITVAGAVNDGYTGSTVGETIFNTNSQLTLSALGSQALTITNGRNIGIGTVTPGEKLDVNGAIKLRANNYTTYAAKLYAALDSTHCVRLDAYHNSSTAFEVIGTHADAGGGNVRVAIAKGGQKVGIGTDNPNQELVVHGSSFTGLVLKSDRTTSTQQIGGLQFMNQAVGVATASINGLVDGTTLFKTAGEERLRINSAGKIGINNSAPLYAMHFKNAMASSPSWIHMEVTGSNTVGGGAGIAFDTSASNNATNNSLYLATIKGIRNSSDDGSNDLVFSTSRNGVNGDDGNQNTPKERLRITSTGRVGIGTDNPSENLQIGNDSGTTGGLKISGQSNSVTDEGLTIDWTASNESRFFSESAASTTMKFYTTDSGTRGERLRITNVGDVQLLTGNLILGTNDKGLSFANSSSSPDADSTSSTRIMTDYDEGTCDWEVHRSDGLTTGDNHGDTKVSYTKIGNRVFMSGYVYTRNTGSGTSGLTAIMTDASGNAASLPYTPSHHGTMPITHTRTIIEYARMSVAFESGSKTVYIHTDEGNNSYTPAQNDVGIHNAQTHLVLAFTGSYLTSE